MNEIICCRADCCDPWITPTAPRNVRLAQIAFVALTLIALLATIFYRGPLATPLQTTATVLFFLVSLVLLCVRKAVQDKLEHPPHTADIADAFASGDTRNMQRSVAIVRQTSQRTFDTSTLTTNRSGNLFHQLASAPASSDDVDALATYYRRLKSTIDIDARDTSPDQNTPLHIAYSKGNAVVAEALEKAGADKNKANAHGKFPHELAPDPKESFKGCDRDFSPQNDSV